MQLPYLELAACSDSVKIATLRANGSRTVMRAGYSSYLDRVIRVLKSEAHWFEIRISLP